MSDLTKQYDINVWSQDPGELGLSAYELAYSTNGGVQTGSKWHTIKFKFPQDLTEIEYLLEDLAINHLPFTDYDLWVSDPRNRGNAVPERIAEFLNNLPEYEMEQN